MTIRKRKFTNMHAHIHTQPKKKKNPDIIMRPRSFLNKAKTNGTHPNPLNHSIPNKYNTFSRLNMCNRSIQFIFESYKRECKLKLH